eukprot:COSAG06_NODE_56404_length_285_cov_0.370968_1_plen_43_part_10
MSALEAADKVTHQMLVSGGEGTHIELHRTTKQPHLHLRTTLAQ